MYSSRVIERVSDIATALEISPAGTILEGSLDHSGGGTFIDEEKFMAADVNLLVSVRLMTRTYISSEPDDFQGVDGFDPGLNEFHDSFGDSYISGQVAVHPQYTWAILTKHNASRTWNERIRLHKAPGMKFLDSSPVMRYTATLFDDFMKYKSLIGNVRDMLSNKTNTNIIGEALLPSPTFKDILRLNGAESFRTTSGHSSDVSTTGFQDIRATVTSDVDSATHNEIYQEENG
ncbi:hypothetical protein FVEN_g8844 [Fusarium venenatum]|nr:hypothetical protein FVEN_g8844 [Fusarium venenatum]